MFYDSYEWYHLKLNIHDLNKWCVLDIDGARLVKEWKRLKTDAAQQPPQTLRGSLKWYYDENICFSFRLFFFTSVYPMSS